MKPKDNELAPTGAVTSYSGQWGPARVAETALDVATLAASVAAKPAEAIYSGIRLIRAVVAQRFSEQLRTEWAKFIDDGRIKPDYGDTDQAHTLFADTLESLGDANFDQEQIDLLRKLFLAAASEAATDRESVLAREYLAIGRSLAAGEIRILSAYYSEVPDWRKSPQQATMDNNLALQVLLKRSGLKHTALIARHETSLIEKGLVRANTRGYAEVSQQHYRLTDFGYAFCEFLSCYDQMKSDTKPPEG